MTSGKWDATVSVVTGAIHLRQERCCQDYGLSLCEPENFAIACVADGHGSNSCPYSDEGATEAVNIAIEILREMLPDLSAHKDIRLPKLIETNWKERIRKIHEEKEREPSEPFPYIQYGTTLLGVAATNEFIFVLQIGDGNILLIDNDGNAHPLLAVEENVGEDTESLCLDDAWTQIRTQIIPCDSSNGAAMILLATDGYSNSFANTGGFLKAGSDFFKLWREEGFSYIKENLSDWLRASSDKGSGDDIAMALITFEKT